MILFLFSKIKTNHKKTKELSSKDQVHFALLTQNTSHKMTSSLQIYFEEIHLQHLPLYKNRWLSCLQKYRKVQTQTNIKSLHPHHSYLDELFDNLLPTSSADLQHVWLSKLSCPTETDKETMGYIKKTHDRFEQKKKVTELFLILNIFSTTSITQIHLETLLMNFVFSFQNETIKSNLQLSRNRHMQEKKVIKTLYALVR